MALHHWPNTGQLSHDIAHRVVPATPVSSAVSSDSAWYLTAKPHDEHHFRGDFVISEKVQQEWQREDVHRSAKKNQDLWTEW